MSFRRLFVLSVLVCLSSGPSPAAQVVSHETPARRDARMAWWREARFGLFIHWGIYAVPAGVHKGERVRRSGGEWIMTRASIPIPEYERYAPQFNPTLFNADEWARLARDAGMKYIVITSKHHDGFALYDSKVSDWDVMDRTPFGRDILRELADAARRHGLKLGFYYSIMDWHHPDAQAPNFPDYNAQTPNPNFKRYVEEYLKPQLRELLTNYGEIAVLWFDGEWIADWTEEYGRDIHQFVRALQPQVIVNNRVGKGRHRGDSPQQVRGLTKEGHVGDYGTPEQHIPPQGFPGVDWESCMTMNRTWGYKSWDDDWKDPKVLIRTLVDIASKGGNYLLNVGPMADGRIPEPSVWRLREMGAWLRVNGESVYGTIASPFPEQPSWGRFTRKAGKLYAHIFEWPQDGKLVIAGVREKPERIYVLADGKPLAFERTEGGLVVQLPVSEPSFIDAVLVIETQEKFAE
jgi:alpha-L-fucosidase